MRAISFLVPFLFFACNNHNDALYGDFEEVLDIPATEQAAPPADASMAEMVEKKVIKTGGLDFQSVDIKKDYEAIQRFLPDFNAYIESENQSNSPHQLRLNLTIRVPADRYEALFDTLTHLSKRPDNKYSNVEDVSERYYDLQTRIKNQKALEDRYRELLDRATEVKEMLEIEKSLNEVRTNIERLEGQFKYLSDRIGHSTIHLNFYEVLPYSYDANPRKGFGARILNALENGWQGFLTFLVVLIRLWPFMIILGILAYLLSKVWRKKGDKRE